jgi:hypothetical protein
METEVLEQPTLETAIDAPINATIDAPADAPPQEPLTFEQEFEKRYGKAFDEKEVKEKLNYVPPPPPPTQEESAAKLKAEDDKLATQYLKSGKTVEEYASIKDILKADSKEIGLLKMKKDLKDSGFTDTEIEKALKQANFSYTEEELEDLDEEEKASYLKQKAFGEKKLEARGQYLKDRAESIINSLKAEIAEEEQEKAKIEQHASTVEAAITAFEKKQSIKLGKFDDEELPNIDVNYSETVMKAVREDIIDPVKFENNFLKQDGNLNLDYFLPILAKAKAFDEGVKTGFLNGRSTTVEIFQKTYGGTPPKLGSPATGETTPKAVSSSVSQIR